MKGTLRKAFGYQDDAMNLPVEHGVPSIETLSWRQPVAGIGRQSRFVHGGLTATIDKLRNDPAYIEKLAREDLGYVREGETVLKFPANKPR